MVQMVAAPPPAVQRRLELSHGVVVSVLQEGDERHFPQKSVAAHVVGRLPSGCVFESTEGKGQPPMTMLLGKNAIIPGMELGLKSLSLGSVAEIHIPAELGYGDKGVPHIVPPSSDLLFEVHVLEVDGTPLATRSQRPKEVADTKADCLQQPWWLARVAPMPPSEYYLNFCRETARGRVPPMLQSARSVARRRCSEMDRFDVGTAEEPFIVVDMQEDWPARDTWDLSWLTAKLGHTRQLVKWLGPIFTRQENLWEAPVFETSLGEYTEYIRDLERLDPDSTDENAPSCPRLYLNGWPAFAQLPWLRNFVVPGGEGVADAAASADMVIEDLNSLLIRESEALRESLLEGLTARGSYQPPDPEEQKEKLQNEDWDLTKIFISPKGAITRLHYDNGGAHAWLSQIQGRKMFVCFPPSDGEHLHPFEGDEGLMNGSWLDPLDPDVFQKWPDSRRATVYMAVVEQGETIVAPKGWWHYAVSLDTSVTIMRNFYSTSNQWDLIQRKDGGLANAIATHVLRKQPKLKNQPDSVINDIANKTVHKLRETFIENRRKVAQQ
ncbi:FPR1 [Symbiodinium pilosum]|uniref:peptidylprolyl isomerase n=1 Tax=Symbiodinium pilosum TaxID=2952 RepID=A0A812VWG7_SYMPI|nr:FPR1 [Symbiodinium pilosum]